MSIGVRFISKKILASLPYSKAKASNSREAGYCGGASAGSYYADLYELSWDSTIMLVEVVG